MSNRCSVNLAFQICPTRSSNPAITTLGGIMTKSELQTALVGTVMNVATSFGGCILLGIQFGWKAGVGFWLLAMFLKQPEN